MPPRPIKLTVRVVAGGAEQASPESAAGASSPAQRPLAPAIELALDEGVLPSVSSIRSVQFFSVEPGEKLEVAVEEPAHHHGASDATPGAAQHGAPAPLERIVWRSAGEREHGEHSIELLNYHAHAGARDSARDVHTTDFDGTSDAQYLHSIIEGRPSSPRTACAAPQPVAAAASSHRTRVPEHVGRSSGDMDWRELVAEMAVIAQAEGIEGPAPLPQGNGGVAVARAPRIAYRSRSPRERFERGWWSVSKMLREAGADQKYAAQLEGNRIDRYLDLRDRGFPGGYRRCAISAYLDDIDAVNALP